MTSVHQFPKYVLVLFLTALILACGKKKKEEQELVQPMEKSKTKKDIGLIIKQPEDVITPEGMVWIPGGEFTQGASSKDQMAMDHEKPAHRVAVDGFFIDITEVTNAQFKKFVQETGYISVAERKVDWEELKKQLPEGTPKPHDSIMKPGSLTFKKTETPVPNLYDFSQWWRWTIGANWRQPNGPESNIKGKDNYPVVHISYEDALAYCEWAGRRLPTESEWERAVRGTKDDQIYFWGNDVSLLSQMANTWEGEFPVTNSRTDGYETRSPVKSFPPNEFGLYDIAGNVWEWTSDWYNTDYYKIVAGQKGIQYNPSGADKPFNARDPYAKEKIIKGGSFLCNASYCSSYRISSRMATSTDSSLEHLGLRTVATIDMIRNNK